MPGVRSVGAVSGFPLIGGGSDGAFIIMSRADEQLVMTDIPKLMKDPTRSGYANFLVVDGDYFDAMSIPVVRGRTFTHGDTPDAPHVGVISASLARLKWPNESPIGKIIQYGNMDGDLRPFTVIGVVGDVRDQNLAADPQATFYAYQPQRQHAAASLHVVMQVSSDPTSAIASTRSIVRQLRPDVSPVVRTMESVVSTSVADRRFVLMLVGVFGGAALVLAALGVYSVISYLVTQRRQEIGVRIALGARGADVLALVLRQGAVLAVIGIAIGGIGALFLTRLLKGLVYGVSTTDPIAFAGVIGLLTAVALLASWLPARRAARVDPHGAACEPERGSVRERVTTSRTHAQSRPLQRIGVQARDDVFRHRRLHRQSLSRAPVGRLVRFDQLKRWCQRPATTEQRPANVLAQLEAHQDLFHGHFE